MDAKEPIAQLTDDITELEEGTVALDKDDAEDTENRTVRRRIPRLHSSEGCGTSVLSEGETKCKCCSRSVQVARMRLQVQLCVFTWVARQDTIVVVAAASCARMCSWWLRGRGFCLFEVTDLSCYVPLMCGLMLMCGF